MSDLPNARRAGAWVSTFTACVVGLGVVGAWVYSDATQASAVGELGRRVDVLSTRNAVAEASIEDTKIRLTKIETMIAYLVDEAQQARNNRK